MSAWDFPGPLSVQPDKEMQAPRKGAKAAAGAATEGGEARLRVWVLSLLEAVIEVRTFVIALHLSAGCVCSPLNDCLCLCSFAHLN